MVVGRRVARIILRVWGLAVLAAVGCSGGGGGGNSGNSGSGGDESSDASDVPVAWYLAFTPHATLTSSLFTAPGTIVKYAPGSDTLSSVATVGTPPTAVDGFDRFDPSQFHFSIPSYATVDGVAIAPGDIALSDGGSVSIAIAHASVGLPAGADIDALARRADGSFLVSLDTHARIGGMVFDDADILLVDKGAITLYASSLALGLDAAADVDGLAVAADGTTFVSLATGGSADGTAYDHADIVSVSASTGFGGVEMQIRNKLSTAANVAALDTNQ